MSEGTWEAEPPAPSLPRRPTADAVQRAHHSHGLLAVGGEPSGLTDVVAMLQPLGQPVHEAVLWSEAFARELDRGPTCLLLDARHSADAGAELAYRLRGRPEARRVPILILGGDAEATAELLRRRGFKLVDALPEPLRASTLRARVGLFHLLQRKELARRAALAKVKTVKSAAREHERMLHTLVGNLPGAAYRCDNTPGYPFSYVSPGVLELTGYSPDDFTGQRVLWGDLIHPEDAPRVWEEVQAGLAEGDRFTLTYRLHTRSGEERWVWERGVAIHGPEGQVEALEGFVTDITALQRARAQQSFLASASMLLSSSLDFETTIAHLVQRTVPELADGCTVDIVEQDGNLRRLAVAHVDPHMAEALWELARIQSLRIDAPIGPGAVIRTGVPMYLPEVSDDQLRLQAQSPRALELLRSLQMASVLVLPLQSRGRTLGALSVAFNKSGRRLDRETQQLLEELTRRAAIAIDNARLYSDAQLAVKVRDQFLSVASHELKTPLTPLSLKLTALERGLQQPCDLHHSERTQGPLAASRRQVRKLTALADAMLEVDDLSQGGLALSLEEVDLGEVARDVAEWFAPDAHRADSELRVEAAPRVVGQWDRIRVEQVLSNLLSNAVRHGAGHPILVQAEEEGDWARLRVCDEGGGIAPEVQEHLFERFGKFEKSASKRHPGGLGLGLYVTRGIVEALGGNIRAENRPGRGATFTVELPCAGPQKRAT